MAGDWIKVETGTASKTEVLRMAEMLGVDRRHCMGLLIDYWSWLDANARTDSVPNLSRSSLDSVLNCPGFAACIEAVGWAKWSQDGWQMTVVNYDHHNGSSAKTRASEQRKKREQRGRERDTTGTREEKRRTTTSLRSVVVAQPLTAPTDRHAEIAATSGVSCQAEFVKYKDWLASSGKSHKDESAGFRNWLRRCAESKQTPSLGKNKPSSLAERRAANMAELTGQTRYERNNGDAERVGGQTVPALPGNLRKPGGHDVG